MTSLRPDQIITDPLTALSQPSAVEAALASRLGSDPFAMGHSFAARMRREAQAGSLAQQQQQANAMRSVLAQRIMQQEAQANALSNIADVRETIGAPGAAQAAGLLPTPFAAARNPVDLAQIQADAQLTASEAAREGAQAGMMVLLVLICATWCLLVCKKNKQQRKCLRLCFIVQMAFSIAFLFLSRKCHRHLENVFRIKQQAEQTQKLHPTILRSLLP